jgi:acetyltransferase-like isoleucine patch superfamily enzyme
MLYHTVATSNHWFFRLLRGIRRAVLDFSVPAPRVLTAPILAVYLAGRTAYHFLLRVFVCEPMFKAYCTRYGRNLHTGVYIHFVQGQGELIVGDNVTIDGKCDISFAARYTERPTLIIGNDTFISHFTTFTVGDRITVGNHCQIASNVTILDAPGHPLDPVARREGQPAPRDQVRPVTIEDNVWIGQRAIILPGVTIGQGSVVSAGAVVMTSVPPNVLVAGNPARQIRTIVAPAPVPAAEG